MCQVVVRALIPDTDGVCAPVPQPIAAALQMPHATSEHLQSSCKYYDGIAEPSNAGPQDSNSTELCGAPADFSARRMNVRSLGDAF